MTARHHKHPQFWILWGGICNFISGKTDIMGSTRRQARSHAPVQWYLYGKRSDQEILRRGIGGHFVSFFKFMLASSGCVVIKKTTSETLFILTCSLSSATYTISIKLLSNSFNIKFCIVNYLTMSWRCHRRMLRND